MQKRHVTECEASLKYWHGRRKDDTKGDILPRKNIQPILARLDALYNCLYYMENRLRVDFKDYKILDTGCADGYGLTPFLVTGFSMDQLYGIDLFEERINKGRAMYPGLKLHVGDATEMDIFQANHFDMVMEQFCFCHIMDDSIREKIANQMLNVVKLGGYILVMDWAIGYAKYHYNGVSKNKVKKLFGVGEKTEIIKIFPAQLVPPIGRALSNYVPFLYPLVKTIFPFLVLSSLTLLRVDHS